MTSMSTAADTSLSGPLASGEQGSELGGAALAGAAQFLLVLIPPVVLSTPPHDMIQIDANGVDPRNEPSLLTLQVALFSISTACWAGIYKKDASLEPNGVDACFSEFYYDSRNHLGGNGFDLLPRPCCHLRGANWNYQLVGCETQPTVEGVPRCSLTIARTPVSAFQHASDIEAFDLHFRAIAFVIRDVQQHVTKVEQARSSPFPEWASVRQIWEDEDIGESEARLGRQLSGLVVYLKVSRPESEAEQLVEVTDPNDRACLIAAWDDAAFYISPPAHVPSLAVPVSVDGPLSPRTQHTGTVSPGTESSQYAQTVQDAPAVRHDSAASHTDSSNSSATNFATVSHLILQASSNAPVDLGQQRGNGYWRDAIKGQGMYIPSARKIKSMAMLQKAPIEPAIVRDFAGQGDEVNPAEFKTRVSGYARGISPLWELATVSAKKKESKQRYRNRFTRDPADDLSQEKLQSQFKVAEKELWDAILNREVEKVPEIMEHHWSDNLIVEKRDRLTALHLAASLGLCSIVQILVSLGASPNHPDRYGVTAMHYAADFGCARCLHILALANGKPDQDLPKAHVKTALFYAARNGNLEATRALLSLGARVYTQNTTPQETILYAAVESGNIEVCEAVLDKGGNPGESFDVLALAAATSREILALLTSAGADINIHDSERETLLHKFVAMSNMSMVSFLLALGADPKRTADNVGRMALHLTLDKGGNPDSPVLAKALLEAGDNPDARNFLGQTPLYLAVVWGRADVAAVLCHYGARMDIADSKGATPLEETQLLNYERRVGNTTFADFPGTQALLERWRHGSSPNIPEAGGRPLPMPEIDGRLMPKPTSPPRIELANTPKPLHELNSSLDSDQAKELVQRVEIDVELSWHINMKNMYFASMPVLCLLWDEMQDSARSLKL
ncbi:nacht and ankyrin domain protein [Seiridium cupressi]